jgi:hypothetical protein
MERKRFKEYLEENRNEKSSNSKAGGNQIAKSPVAKVNTKQN